MCDAPSWSAIAIQLQPGGERRYLFLEYLLAAMLQQLRLLSLEAGFLFLSSSRKSVVPLRDNRVGIHLQPAGLPIEQLPAGRTQLAIRGNVAIETDTGDAQLGA